MAESSLSHSRLDLRREALTRTIFNLAWPAVVENLLATAVFFADAILVGWLHDDNALAAVGLGGTVMFIVNGFFDALAISAVALVARAWGEGDRPAAERFAAQALTVGLLMAAAMMLLLLPTVEPFLALLGATPTVSHLGGAYLRAVLSTSLLSFPMAVANGIMRSTGDTRTPMWLTLIMNVWNVAIASALVFGLGPFPALGLVGAGWATASARALGGLLAMGALFTGKTKLRLRPKALLHWQGSLVWRILRLALPNIVETAISRAGYIAFMAIVTSLTIAAQAAHQIALRIESLSFMPAWGFSVAAAALAGQSLGAGDQELADLSIRRTLLYALGLMAGIGLIFAFLSRPIVAIFGSTPEALALAAVAVRIAAVEQVFLGVQMVLAGGLRGAGDTRTPMWVTLFGTTLFRVPVVYLFAVVLHGGVAGVWWGTTTDWVGRSVLMWVLFRRGKWKRAKV